MAQFFSNFILSGLWIPTGLGIVFVGGPTIVGLLSWYAYSKHRNE